MSDALSKFKEVIEKQDAGGTGGGASYGTASAPGYFTPTYGMSNKKMPGQDEIQRFVDALQKQHTIPETLVGRPKMANTSWHHMDRSKLTRRLVQAKKADGTRYWTTRWVKYRPETDDKTKKEKPLFAGGGKNKAKEMITKNGGIITFIPPQNIKDKLYMEGGEEKEEMHVTIIYLPFPWYTSITKVLQNSMIPTNIGKLTGRLEKFGTKDAEQSALVALLEIPGLDKWRDNMVQLLKQEEVDVGEDFPIFKPHITLKYIPKEEDVPINMSLDPEEFEFDRLELWAEDEKSIIFDYTKQNIKKSYDEKDLLTIINSNVQEIKKMDDDGKEKWWEEFQEILNQVEDKGVQDIIISNFIIELNKSE